MTTPTTNPIRCRLEIGGRVQGVGFRPFVYRLATELKLAGFVSNDARGVVIETEAAADAIETFVGRLHDELPPLAQISRLDRHDIPTTGDRQFHILPSRHEGQQDAELTPDVATCDDCLNELLDPSDRRHRYPFINCTNCGPRYSIVQGVPYDRCNTTMSAFTMCPDCQAEYDDPMNRRFHAQPNACPICGPRVRLVDREGKLLPGDPIAECARFIREGKIAAIKGIGGFHLACDATSDRVTHLLRQRKGRDSKPFAVMVGTLESARELANINDAAGFALQGPARPIVLAPTRPDAPISRHVAPGCDSLGMMLPYTPIHHLLFDEGLGPIVLTSGNPVEEPLCCNDDESLARLNRMAEVFLLHDRAIERRVDDSVVVAVESPARTIVQIRRARGYAPAPIHLDTATKQPILAVGGELKSTIALHAGCDVILSEHLGELSNPLAYRHFVATIDQLKTLYRIEPEVVAYDLHPDYAATRFAKQLDLQVIGVQHHHAHMVSCMADNRITGPTVGIICDGTGYGTDGAVWGCEILVGDEIEFERAGHLRYFQLLGGDSAAKDTWRPAVGLLHQTFGDSWRDDADSVLDSLSDDQLSIAHHRLSQSKRTVQTSSLGRLFDAVAFLIGLCSRNGHEAEAAMALEAAARAGESNHQLRLEVSDKGDIDPRSLIQSIIRLRAENQPAPVIAASFHEAVATALAQAATQTARQAAIHRVVLSGGCFFNRLLLEQTAAALTRNGLQALFHQQVPAGDGGLALGQAVTAARRLD